MTIVLFFACLASLSLPFLLTQAPSLPHPIDYALVCMPRNARQNMPGLATLACLHGLRFIYAKLMASSSSHILPDHSKPPGPAAAVIIAPRGAPPSFSIGLLRHG